MSLEKFREDIEKKGLILLLGLTLSVAACVEKVKADVLWELDNKSKKTRKVEQNRIEEDNSALDLISGLRRFEPITNKQRRPERCGDGLDGYIDSYDCSEERPGFRNNVHIHNSEIHGNVGIRIGGKQY